ncbi:HGGxSTG domain-containing protein [Porphyrobacter sp. LM 6]|uniref:HGGxSTG domain-containing protein n=1 Tax=Porphyrobacter sp. LM 6 TaxID=1896196 RepID=UPI00086384CB|nr:HGGxSTG domain-containing protein [Porphyrobacter sp. LM 6]AOL93013.1 glucans biosynthesis protein [Porphyrobacter sp. LM 6]
MAGDHVRNVAGMHAAPRCGARTRSGGGCEAPAVKDKARCRMHGGAQGSGAPRGNRNALKSGLYTAESLALRRHVSQLIRESRKIIEEM